jgi:hypothetical protein
VLVAAGAALDDGADVPPGEVGEGQADAFPVDPGDLRPAAWQPYPDLIGVVGVVVDLPHPVAGGRLVPAVRVEDLVVVGAVVEADAVVVDAQPFDRHELDVVLFAEQHRNMARQADQRGPHLVR